MKTVLAEINHKNISKHLNRIEGFIGNTPLFQLQRIFGKPEVRIYAKLEWQQLGGSVKSRPAFNIIKEAVIAGELHEGVELIDATSGNTGIAYTSIAAALGLGVTLCVPENISEERKNILHALGAKLVFTSPFGGTDEAQQRAQGIYEKNPDKYFYANQYANNNNWKAHYHGTALEILRQTDQKITHFVAGLGTTGTFTGTGSRLKEYDRNIQLIGLQPDTPLHGLEGWKHLETAIVPKIYKPTLADSILEVSTERAYELMAKVAQEEGLMISPSAAANLAGAIEVASEIEAGTVVTVFPDNAGKYSDLISKYFNQK